MKIPSIHNTSYLFSGKKSESKKSNTEIGNPISSFGEKSKLVKATFIAGLGIGSRLLYELADGDFVFDTLESQSKKVVNKAHSSAKGIKRTLLQLGACIGLIGAFIGGFSLLYTLFKAPNINYKGNINTFKNKKDMDVYIKSNNAEREIYTQMNEKAKTANTDEKDKLKVQYLQMQMAKNKVPNFAK